mmetsp:Transcript_41034/g.71008  ORF Transcript_41034/g.71008 Transcript_41034/m.71008 type:complete len:258 (-) Transcript_41034:403-1176(-)
MYRNKGYTAIPKEFLSPPPIRNPPAPGAVARKNDSTTPNTAVTPIIPTPTPTPNKKLFITIVKTDDCLTRPTVGFLSTGVVVAVLAMTGLVSEVASWLTWCSTGALSGCSFAGGVPLLGTFEFSLLTCSCLLLLWWFSLLATAGGQVDEEVFRSMLCNCKLLPVSSCGVPGDWPENLLIKKVLISCTDTMAPFPFSLQARVFSTGPSTSHPQACSLDRDSCVLGCVHITVFIAGHRMHGLRKSQARITLSTKLSAMP